MDAITRADRDLSPKTFAILAGAIVALAFWLRLSYAEFGRLTDGDQSIIATSTIALERGLVQRLYNYPEQMGFYELARFVHWAGPDGGPERIRDIMIGISAISGGLLTLLALLAFPRELTRRTRLLFGFVLILSPVLWRLTQYGNTATPSGTMVLAAFVVASRTASVLGAAFSGLLLAAAMLIRSDAILAAPALAYYVWRRERGAWWHGFAVAAGVGLAIAVARGRASALEIVPLSDSVLDVVFNTTQKGFWLTYVYWGLGPTILLASAAGWPALGRLPALWRTTLFWGLPPFLFYAPWATTPRYTMLMVAPVALCAALGVDAIIRQLRGRSAIVRFSGLAVLCVVLCQHMFIAQTGALPGTRPGETSDWFKPLTYQVGDGPHFYGALLMQARFSVPAKFYPRDRAGAELAELVVENADRPGRWMVIIDFWDDLHASAFHLIANSAAPYQHKQNEITVGRLTIDFAFRGVIEALGGDTDSNKRTLARLGSATRVFRETGGEAPALMPKIKSIFGAGVVTTPRGTSGELIEITLPKPPASRPATLPATRQSG